MKSQLRPLFGLLIVSAILVVSGQNCSRVDFQSAQTLSAKATSAHNGESVSSASSAASIDCGSIVITDLILNIEKFELSVLGGGEKTVDVYALNSTVHLADLQAGLPIVSERDLSVRAVNLILAKGNKFIDEKGSVRILDTPSADTSGIKIFFDGAPIEMKKGRIYRAKFASFNPATQLLQSAEGCMLHPVWKSAIIE